MERFIHLSDIKMYSCANPAIQKQYFCELMSQQIYGLQFDKKETAAAQH